MRIRNVVAAVGAAPLLVALPAAPAAAGTGASKNCSDGLGYREVPILTSPVTVGLEVQHAPSSAGQRVWICYSTAGVGQPAYLTSGGISIDFPAATSTAYPGAYVVLNCYPDFVSGIGPAC